MSLKYFSIVIIMEARKIINFYYATKDSDGFTVYKCLYNNSDCIVTVKSLDYDLYKHFKSNQNYEQSDADLFRFRDDLNKHNNDIKKIFFVSKEKKTFKIDVFHNNSINHAVYNTVIINSDQLTINKLPNILFKEFCMFQKCSSGGLIRLDLNIVDKPIDVYGYDYAKYYYNIMRKIRIPSSKPVFTNVEDFDMTKLKFGYYRVKVTYENPIFSNVFNINENHHYSHHSLKTLYKYKDKYKITFDLLPIDKDYAYNAVLYEETVELKVLLKGWFSIIDELLLKCDKSNWLVKMYISQAWGILCAFNKSYIGDEDIENYDFDHLSRIDVTNRYDYYNYKYENDKFALIDSKKPYKHKGLARIKPFLCEYARNFMFDMISSNDLETKTVRIQTDSACFTEKINFKALKLKYYPIEEAKTTGKLIFSHVNYYRHVCPHCKAIYKYDKHIAHTCEEE